MLAGGCSLFSKGVESTKLFLMGNGNGLVHERVYCLDSKLMKYHSYWVFSSPDLVWVVVVRGEVLCAEGRISAVSTARWFG